MNDYAHAGREWEAEQERKRREAEFVEQHKSADAFNWATTTTTTTTEGISLRDWFAGQALGAVYATYLQHNKPEVGWFGDVARVAYEVADAMLEEREKADETI